MNTESPSVTPTRPNRFWAYVAAFTGGLLLLSGFAATLGYLGLPLFSFGEDMLAAQLGQMAAIFLGLVCGSLALFHGLGSILNRPSRPLKLPPFYLFWIVFALTLGLGNLLIRFDVSAAYLFPLAFLLAAALPTLAVLAWALRRLGWPITGRQASLALAAGSTLSVGLAIIIETFLPYLAYLLVEPLEYLAGSFGDLLSSGGPGLLERLFYSPLILVFLIATALAAPIPEEFAKALGVPMFGRGRITSERQAFALGLACGAGFAILENMLYEGLYAQWSGWSWGGIALLRGFGSVLHPIGTGLVALGWYRARQRGWQELLKAYAVAVGLHTLWNGGFDPLVFLTGLDRFAGEGPSLSFYGEAIPILLVAYLVALSLFLWGLLRRIVNGLASNVEPDLAPAVMSRRALATLAFVSALVIVPIGAALGPAWPQIGALFVSGR